MSGITEPDPAFPATRVSILDNLAASSLETRRDAFDLLARAYWKPLCGYARIRWSRGSGDAEELVQGFLAVAWEKEYFRSFDPVRSRFRTFLRVCFDRYIMVRRREENSLRRGGGKEFLSWDAVEELSMSGFSEASTAEKLDELFDWEFKRELFRHTTGQLETELRSRGKEIVFQVFTRRELAEEPAPGYAELAAEFGVSVAQITNFLHAARKRFRELVLTRLRELSHSHDEFRQEVWSLLGIRID